jgi:DNA-binding MarR family transcriptional regulator
MSVPGLPGVTYNRTRINYLTQDDLIMDHLAPLRYGIRVPESSDDVPGRPGPADPPETPGENDLTWLAYRAADALGQAFNKVAREAGLADLRDWLVLALVSGPGTPRTQLGIATQLGIDKSTLVPLLDRLERDGLIVRAVSERDRRVRIPQATPAGVEIVKKVAIARDAAISERLAAIPPDQRPAFHAMLWSIVGAAGQPA